MTETASNTFEIVPAGSTSANLFSSLSTLFNSTEWDTASTIAQTWEVKVESGTSIVLGLIATVDGAAGPKIYIENLSSSLYVKYDPNGVVDAGVYTASSACSPLVSFTGAATAPSAVTRIYAAQYSDAIMIHFDQGDFFKYMIHAGIVMAPDNASDPDIYIDGSGLIVGQPGVIASAVASISFVSTGVTVNTAGHQSYLRIGETKWGQVRLATADYLAAGNETKDINGRVRLVPMLLRVATNIDGVTGSIASQVGNVSGELGRTRYLRFYKANPVHRSVLPSREASSQQAWLAWSHGTTAAVADNVLALWRKEDPTIVS
jgi:hypothetical protein